MNPIYIPGFVDRDIADQEFTHLWDTLDWERRPDAPRREYWQNNYSVPYTYGRGAGLRTYEARPWDGMVEAWMQRLNAEHGFALDCCFINGYETKRDSLGWHADVSPEMRTDQPVISLSLGGERDIEVRENATGETQRYRLAHGSVFIMPPSFQQTHQHRIPKAGYDVPPRISLTYRALDLAVIAPARLALLGWNFTPVSLYDEDGVEGWRWEREGREITEMGDHSEPPVIPDELLVMLEKSNG